MKIFITGGNGHLGSRLTQYLKSKGYEIIIAVRNSIKSEAWNYGVKVVTIDWDNLVLIKNELEGVSIILHTAGLNALDASLNPEKALKFNGIKTIQLANLAKMAGVKAFYYFSTAHVYANPLSGVISEATCTRNYHPYATANLAGENAVLSLNEPNVFNGLVLRISNTFGVPMHSKVDCWNLVVNDLCKQAINERKLIIKSNINQYKDFISINTFCLILESLIDYSKLNIFPPIFNIGSGNSLTLIEIAEKIQVRCNYLFGYKPEIIENLKVNQNSKHEKLFYKTENLNQLGIRVCENYDNEIDKLLVYCKNNIRH